MDSHRDQAAQIQRRRAVVQPEVVLGHAAIAEFCGCLGSARRSSVPPWSVLAVLGLPFGCACHCPSGAQVVFVFTDREIAATLVVHCDRKGHERQCFSNFTHPWATPAVRPAGQVTVWASKSTLESSPVNPRRAPAHATGSV